MAPQADKLLLDLTGRYAKPYVEALQEMLVAVAMQNAAQVVDARAKLAKVILETMGVAEVVGATMALQRAAGIQAQSTFNRACGRLVAFAEQSTQAILPRVTLSEALEDMVSRVPVTIRAAAERTAERIAQLYSTDRVIAFARSAEQAVTERVHQLIAEAIREGIGEGEAGKGIKMAVDEIRNRTKPWTEAYARMAFRTNVNTAVTAGRFRQSMDPDIMAVQPAFMFSTAGDSDVRDNHRYGNGIILLSTNPAWARIAPPLGYNCRCRVDELSLPMLRRMGRLRKDGSVRESNVPARLKPDEGFRHGGRPDLWLSEVMGG